MQFDITQLLQEAIQTGASDVFIVAGLPFSMRINGVIVRENEEKLTPADTSNIVSQIYQLAGNRDILSPSQDCHAFVSARISKEVPCPL